MRIGNADHLHRAVLEGKAAAFVIEHDDAVIAQRIGHRLRVVVEIVIAEHGETAARGIKTGKSRGNAPWRYPAAAERLHVDVVAAEQRHIGRKACGLGDDRFEPRHVARMRAGMKIGQKRDPQRARPRWPARDRELKVANRMRLRPAQPLEGALAAQLVVERRPREGAQQPHAQSAGNSVRHASHLRSTPAGHISNALTCGTLTSSPCAQRQRRTR